MINSVILIGRMTKDPELRRTSNGNAVTTFTLAVNRNQESTDFINCVCWNKTAENVSQYCYKGSLVGIQGRLQTRSYKNKFDAIVYVTEVLCNTVQFLETKRENKQQEEETEVNNTFDIYNVYENEIEEDDIEF